MRTQAALAIVLLPLLLAATPAQPEELDDLDFLVGGWRVESGSARVEEHWIPADGGTMLGVSRTVVAGATAEFEFLRIERRADGRIFYIAQPNGQAGTEFELTRLTDREAVFENPRHDHPKVIRYQRASNGRLTATIEGDSNGKPVSLEFRFEPLN